MASNVGGTGKIDDDIDGLASRAQSMQLAGSDDDTELNGCVSIDTIGVAVDVASASYAFEGFSSSNNVEPCEDQCKCTHPYLHKWSGVYLCMDCWYKFNDTTEATEKNADRIALEVELEGNTPADVVGEGQSVGSMSAARGVKIGWLLAFTKYYDCYEWNSWEVIRKILKPATEERRCRVVELPEMASFVGPAKTFISYAQAGKWGDLVAAIADGGADLDRCVWIDLFAVRQWPSDKPDLDFASTIEHCSSFMVVCSYLKELDSISLYDIKAGDASIYDLDMSVKKRICFLRVWCLVEAHKACTMPGMPYMMKVGHHVLRDGCLQFHAAPRHTIGVFHMSVDVEMAEATVESDRQRIIDDIDAGVGVDKLNSTIRGAIMAAMDIKNSAIQCAACGDLDATETVLADPKCILELSSAGFEDLLTALLDRDIITDIDMKDEDGSTALLRASGNGHESCVQALLGAGADKDAKDNEGRTALRYASSNGHESCVQALLGAGADKDAKDNDGGTALLYASSNGHESCVRALLDAGADKDVKENTEGWTALMQACICGHESIVRALLEAGAVVDVRSNDGLPALMLASSWGRKSIVQTLLEAGADMDAKNAMGWTALMAASVSDFESVVQTLLDAGADKDVQNSDGNTALLLACTLGHEFCVQALLVAGADMDVMDNDGYTALMRASYNGEELCVLLLRYEACVRCLCRCWCR